MRTEILHEDKDILVVYKPSGFAVQTAKIGQLDVVSELKNYLWKKRIITGAALGGSAPYLGIIHRLDQPVEGLLVFAKNAGTAAVLTEQLQKQGEKGMFHKRYYAVLCGSPAEEEGELVNYLYKSRENKAVIADPEDEAAAGDELRTKGQEAKKAVLQYRVLARVTKGEILTLADIHLETGRFHQIRAQMAHAGTPLLGDTKYGNEKANAVSRALYIQGAALCAYSLELVHPFTEEKMDFRIKPRGKAFSFFQESF